MPLRSRVRAALLSAVALGVLYTGAATQFEKRRIAAQVVGADPAVASTTHETTRIDRETLTHDLRALADPALEGRRTGTPGGRRARAYIADALKQSGAAPFEGAFVHPFAFTHTSIKGLVTPGRDFQTAYDDAANVVGIVPGTAATTKRIVVSAHYDHLGIKDGTVYPGADDDASGVAAMLAIARLVARSPARHPIVFAAFDAEELGLEGSKHFVESDRVSADTYAIDVNLDMVARNDRHEIFAAGTTPYPWLRPLVEQVQRRTPVRILFGHDRPMYQAGLVDDWTHSSDHGPFFDAGVPFLYFGVEDHPDYHRSTDTVDKIDPAFYGDVVDMVADMVRVLDRVLD